MAVLVEGRIYPLLGESRGYYRIAENTWVEASICLTEPEPGDYHDTPPINGDPDPYPPPPPADTSGDQPGPIVTRDDLWTATHDLAPRLGRTKGDKEKHPIEGLPETIITRDGAKYAVSQSLLEYMLACTMLLHPDYDHDQASKELAKLFRNNGGWSNKSGMESDRFRIAGLVSGGCTLQATKPGPDPIIVKGRGKLWLEVFAIDPKNPPPPPRSLADIDMTRNFFPMTARTAGSNHFPNMGGRCLVPVLGEGGKQYVLADRMVKVHRIQQPAEPPRPDVTEGLIP